MKNFKELKDSVIKDLFESTIKQEKSKDFKKFLTEVKKSPILKLQFEVYNNLENGEASNLHEATYTIENNLNDFKQYSSTEIQEANQQLMESFGYTLGESDEIFTLILESTKDKKPNRKLYTNFLPVATILMENKNKVVEVTEKVDSVVPMKRVIKRATEILNDKFSFLNETEKNIVNSFVTKNEEKKESIFKELVNENLKLVKRKLFESEDDLDLCIKLELIKEKLNTFTYNDKTEIKEFSQLIDLQSTLR